MNKRSVQEFDIFNLAIGSVTHKVKNHLATVVGAIQLTMLDLPKGELYDNMQLAVDAAMQSAKMLDKLEIMSEDFYHETKVVDVKDLFQEIEEEIRLLTKENIQVHRKFADNLSPIKVCDSYIKQAILNIITNSCDAMINGGILSIEVADISIDEKQAEENGYIFPEGSYLSVIVGDTGEGISDDILEKICVPFFTTKNRKDRLGLGLAISRAIIKLYGGYMAFDKNGNTGTLVKMCFPR